MVNMGEKDLEGSQKKKN